MVVVRDIEGSLSRAVFGTHVRKTEMDLEDFGTARPPIYVQIARVLRSRVFHGLYSPGSPIPSEHDLAEEFGVARLTVRQAIQELRREGVLVSRRGSGTYVPPNLRLLRPVNFHGYIEDFILQSLTLVTKVGPIRTVTAPQDARNAYRLPPRAKVVRLKRTRFTDGIPVQYSVNYLLPDVGRRLSLKELESGSLSEMLSRQLGIDTTSATQRFTAVAASRETAAALEVHCGDPLLFVETIGYNGNEVVNFTHVYYRPEHLVFTAALTSVASDPRLARNARRNQPEAGTKSRGHAETGKPRRARTY